MSSCPISTAMGRLSGRPIKTAAAASAPGPGYKSFAIWGAGQMGKPIIEGLLALRKSQPDIIVTVLTRLESVDSDSNMALAKAGARIVPFDVTSESASDTLADVDVFITTVGGRATPLQPQAAQAAAKAGVKLFIPASWGDRIWERNGMWQRVQQMAHTAADEVGIKTAAFFCGFWPEHAVGSGMYGWHLEQGEIEILGDGAAPISWTYKPDVARYVVHALTTFPRETLEGGEFYIQGQAISFFDLAKQVQAASTKPLEITVSGRQALLDRLAANKFDIPADLCLGADQGLSNHSRFVDKLDNERWPEWNPKTAVEVVVAMLPKDMSEKSHAI